MNLKQLIIFGIENSSEPVIKNPILRAALEEPGSMVGTPTKEVTQHGRRIYETPEGNVSEKSTTFFLNGQWMNVPSIHEGRAFTDDQLRRMIKEGTIQPTSVHGSRVEAETAAGQRSDMMKSHTRGFAEGQLVTPSVDGSRPGYARDYGKGRTNLERKTESIQSYYNKFGKETLDKIAQKKYKKTFDKLGKADLGNLKVRVDKFEDFIIENNRMPSEKEARKFGRIQRDITLNLVNKDKTVNIDAVRENLIKNKKKVTMVNNQFIFADEKLQQEFLDDMILRYKYPKTSTAAKNAGVKSNAQIFEKYFEGTYSESGVHDLINRFKKTLGETFNKLPPSERDAHKLRREAKLLISQAGKRISGLDDFPAHHLFPIGDEFAHGTQDFTIIDKKTNSQLSGPNKKLVSLAEQRSDLINDVQTGKINLKEFDIEIGKLDNQAQTIIDGHYKKFPKHDGLLNWRKAGSMVDDQGRFMGIVSKGTIGGDYSKWAITDINKQIKDLSKTELATFRSDVKNTADDLLNKEFKTTFSKTFQDLSPRSIVQLSKEFDCEVKAKGGSIMSCLQGKFKANPEKFLQKSAPLAKNNVNLYKWFKNGRKIARGTGIALAWEAAFAPIIAGWGALEGQSGQRILNDIAYGIPFIGETEKEEWMREAGGDELAYKMKRMGELEEQDLPNLYQQRADVINKMANVEGKSFHQRTIEDDIKEKELELQGLMNTPDFYEGPVGSYLNEPVIQDAFDLEQQTTAKIAADTAERKKATFDALRKAGMIADRNWPSQVPRAEGGIASLNVKK